MSLKPYAEKNWEYKIGICSDPDPYSRKRIRGSGSTSKWSGFETLNSIILLRQSVHFFLLLYIYDIGINQKILSSFVCRVKIEGDNEPEPSVPRLEGNVPFIFVGTKVIMIWIVIVSLKYVQFFFGELHSIHWTSMHKQFKW